MKELEMLRSDLGCESSFRLLNSEEDEFNFHDIKFEVFGPVGTPLENKKFLLTISPSER